MRDHQQRSNSGLLSGKLGLVIICVVALVLGLYLVGLPMLDKLTAPVISDVIHAEPEAIVAPELEVLAEPDNETINDNVDALEPQAVVAEPQAEFPRLNIDAKDESAQLAQAKAAAEAAARFNKQKMNRLQAVLTEDAGELKSLAKVEISYLVKQWRDAWGAGKTDAYLNFYSQKFVPSNQQSLGQWQARRRNRVIPSKSANIDLSNYNVSFNDDLSISEVEFDQHYASASYNDRARKKLVFAKEPQGWKLISETVLNKGS